MTTTHTSYGTTTHTGYCTDCRTTCPAEKINDIFVCAACSNLLMKVRRHTPPPSPPPILKREAIEATRRKHAAA